MANPILSEKRFETARSETDAGWAAPDAVVASGAASPPATRSTGRTMSANGTFAKTFVLFILVIVSAFFGWAFVSAEWVSGLAWMMLKTFVFVFIFVQMRGTLPRVRVDQLMSFAWKWLLPASLLNIFVTATAVTILANR